MSCSECNVLNNIISARSYSVVNPAAFNGVNAKCFAIKTKHDTYSSFRVLADGHLDKLLEPSIWPAGVLIRDFV